MARVCTFKIETFSKQKFLFAKFGYYKFRCEEFGA
jgi:hypothetical protein